MVSSRRQRLRIAFAGVVSVAAGLAAGPSPGPRAGAPHPSSSPPPQAGTLGADAAAKLHRIEELVSEAVEARKLPGAVVVVGQHDRIVYSNALGDRALVPEREPMTLDTIFDAASLTKVVATTTAVMKLIEEGRIRLSDRVAAFIPEFARYGKDAITVGHLLTHMSGLRPDVDWSFEWVGYDRAIALAVEEVPVAAPDARFVYSDINFFLLGDIVSRVSGEPLDEFVRRAIFEPLGMVDTMFRPPESLRPRIAPTEPCTPYDYPCNQPGAVMLRGVVHDPTTRRMGGVAGHAGLFTTAGDLARFCRMLLRGGEVDGRRILAPLTVARMTAPSTPVSEPNVRALGWDMDSSYSANRGELLAPGSFGHTGFTGGSIWVDPVADAFVVFLSSRLHPDGTGDVVDLRARVATVAAAALEAGPDVRRAAARAARRVPPASGAGPARTVEPVLAGIDVLRAEGFARLDGKRIGLLTNQTGRARDGASTIDLLHQAPGVRLVALFSPEHGIRGDLDRDVPDARDERTGLPIHSLYGETRSPTPAMLEGLDTLVVDLQDVGVRFYTYASSMALAMEAAAEAGLEVVVLDRPNPIDGFSIEGPMLDEDLRGFVGYFPMPVRHGLTLGELARLFNEEASIGARLDVVRMSGWQRDSWFDETGLPWVNPSPNLRNLNQAALYPGIGAIEWANLSVGRGTDSPFEQLGAPWIDGVRLAERVNARALPGVRVYPVSFTPASSVHAGERCEGIFLVVTDRRALRPVRLGAEVLSILQDLHPSELDSERTVGLLGSRNTLSRLLRGDDPGEIAASWSADEAAWRLLRARHLLYR